MRHDFTPPSLRRQIARLSDLDLVRTRYCYQIGSTFVACALLYLRWLKSKRDFFIHRFFHTGAWPPGDLSEELVDSVCRTLGALEIIFRRGAERMIHVLGRAGLMKVEALSGGYLAINPGSFEETNDT